MTIGKRLWMAVTLVVFCILTMAGFSLTCIYLGSSFFSLGVDEEAGYPNVTQQQRQTAALLTKISFPQNSKYLYYRAQRFQDWSLLVKIEVPRSELPALLTSGSLRGVKFENDDQWFSSHINPNLRPPSTMRTFRTAEIDVPPNDFMRILIDESHPTTAVVYIDFIDP